MTNLTSTPPPTLEQALDAFLLSLTAKNRSQATMTAYGADLQQFIRWLGENDLTITTVDQVKRADIIEYLAYLSRQKLSGVSRARKLAAIRELFRSLIDQELLEKSPAATIETPKREKRERTWLVPDEYRGMLAEAIGNARDSAVLQVFLQTGIRVSELCDLRLADVELSARVLRVNCGKGLKSREIPLERKALVALKGWLDVRSKNASSDSLFLNRYGEPFGIRGVQKLVTKYCRLAGIDKRAGCHSLRHTFGTIKADLGVTAFQLRELLGHAHINTTQIYVHTRPQSIRKAMEATSL